MYMTQPDRQRIQHIRDYCEEIRKTIERYGDGFAVFDQIISVPLHFPFCRSVN